ncbi:MAG: hypothetical protein H0S80_12045 [Desulfovibrionaceae bacterium]|nr:hypothetical protein [Desulfovibrionaceae bacterium]
MAGVHQTAYRASFLGSFGIEPRLHPIDCEDVVLTSEGVRLVQRGARAALRRYMPGADIGSLTRSQAVALFVDQLFWEEHSGGLVMCADLPEASLCLPIPRKLWSVRREGAVQ